MVFLYGLGIRERLGGMGRFKGELKCKGWDNSLIINAISEIRCRFNYTYCIVANDSFKCKYIVVKPI